MRYGRKNQQKMLGDNNDLIAFIKCKVSLIRMHLESISRAAMLSYVEDNFSIAIP